MCYAEDLDNFFDFLLISLQSIREMDLDKRLKAAEMCMHVAHHIISRDNKFVHIAIEDSGQPDGLNRDVLIVLFKDIFPSIDTLYPIDRNIDNNAENRISIGDPENYDKYRQIRARYINLANLIRVL